MFLLSLTHVSFVDQLPVIDYIDRRSTQSRACFWGHFKCSFGVGCCLTVSAWCGGGGGRFGLMYGMDNLEDREGTIGRVYKKGPI